MNKQQKEIMWYRNPAERWVEALPIGNGRLGGMVFGGVNKDVVQLNEETIWAGHYQDRNNYQSAQALPEIRRLLFAGETAKASELAQKAMVSNPKRFDSYQPLGDLTIQMTNTVEYSHYCRQLDLANAVASVQFKDNQISFKREYLSSAIDQVIAIRYECDKPGGLDLSVSLTRSQDAVSQIFTEDTIGLVGQCGDKGVAFSGAVKIICENGTVVLNDRRRDGNEIIAFVEKADRVTFYIAANSNYRRMDHREECIQTVQKASEKGYHKVREDHIKDYRAYYDRFSIELSTGSQNEHDDGEVSTYEWLNQIREGKNDPAFAVLYMNYTRYLMISSSRPGCLPSNLQGIWNDQMWAPWESDFHTNVNLQANYWPVEAYHLSECHTPVFDWLETLVAPGSHTAKVCYDARGWVVHHASDIWGSTAIFFDIVGIWPMGAAWMCRHLYEHYLYNLDELFLREKAYPLIKGVVRFLLDFMVEAPEGTACPGSLVCNPSHSPENYFIAPDGSIGIFTYGATMDTEIIYDIGTICVEIIDILSIHQAGFDDSFKEEIMAALKKLPPVKISNRTGGIQEWAEDFEEYYPDHRHISQLYGVYPGKMITLNNSPELANAAKCTINRKYEHGYNGQGWSLSWIANVWARLLEPERAMEALQDIFQHHILHNLFINAHGNPQVGDAQGVPAAILEMLAQSHEDEIVLLPSLPKAWANGSVTGMKLRGGYTLDMFWENGLLTKATLYLSEVTIPMPIRVGSEGRYQTINNGSTLLVMRN